MIALVKPCEKNLQSADIQSRYEWRKIMDKLYQLANALLL